jgi:LPXTG-site transpeptidase (sortase) family protein
VTSDTSDPVPGNNSDTEGTVITPVADLAVTKSDSPDPVLVGNNLTYTLAVTNLGPSPAANLVVTDTLPAGVTFVSASGTGWACSEAAGTVTCTRAALVVGAAPDITVVVTVTPAAVSPITNAVSVSSDTSDPVPANNSDTEQTAISPVIDVSLDKQVNDASPDFGDTVTFTLVVANAGPTIATNIDLTDVVPSGYTYVASSIAGGDTRSDSAPSTTGLTWRINSLASGGSTNLTYQATVLVSGTYDNYAEISDHDQADSDSTPGNGSTTEDDDDTVVVSPVGISDPAVTKTGDPATAVVGDIVTFTVVVTNAGTANADNVELTDPVPAFLNIVNVTVAPAGPVPSIVGNTITIAFGTLTPGQTYTITITTVVNSLGLPPGGTNSADVSTSSPELDPDNNASSALITIVTAAGLPAPATGFAPSRVTRLPAQPENRRYSDLGDLWLEIPALSVKLPIVGVPLTEDGWDVTWLGRQAGWLNSTAFPTWEGNSVLTAHVTQASGRAGPFRNLGGLRWDDQVIIHYAGQRYVFAVRSRSAVTADDASIFRHEERPWLTLLTCGGYDDASDEYRYRVVVKAVLMSIEADP